MISDEWYARYCAGSSTFWLCSYTVKLRPEIVARNVGQQMSWKMPLQVWQHFYADKWQPGNVWLFDFHEELAIQKTSSHNVSPTNSCSTIHTNKTCTSPTEKVNVQSLLSFNIQYITGLIPPPLSFLLKTEMQQDVIECWETTALTVNMFNKFPSVHDFDTKCQTTDWPQIEHQAQFSLLFSADSEIWSNTSNMLQLPLEKDEHL